jgi:hypothetical protein
MEPSPPCFRGVLHQARWEKCESVEQAITEQPSASNSAALGGFDRQGQGVTTCGKRRWQP